MVEDNDNDTVETGLSSAGIKRSPIHNSTTKESAVHWPSTLVREVGKLMIGDMMTPKAEREKAEKEEKLLGEAIHWLRWIGLSFKVKATIN